MADVAMLDQLRSRIESIERGGSSSQAVGGRPRGKGAGSAHEKDPASAEDAFGKVVALVNAADRSERAVRERLAQAGFEESAADEAVERAKSYGFIDDARFAAVLVRSRLSQGRGIPGIERELRSHGIELYDVPGWPDEFDAGEGAEFDRALALLERKPPRSKNQREGAYRKLVSKGFSSATAAAAARSWHEKALARPIGAE